MGAVIDRSNDTAVSCTYYYTAAGNHNLRSRVRGEYYRGRFQSWWIEYSVYIDYE